MATSSRPLLKFIAVWSLACKLTALGSVDVHPQSCKVDSSDTARLNRCDRPVSLLQLKLTGLARSFTSLHDILHDGETEELLNDPKKGNSTSSVKEIERHMEKSMNEKTQKNISNIKNHLSEPRRHKDIVWNQTNATKTVPLQAKTIGRENGKRHRGEANRSSLKNVTVETTAFASAKYQTNSTEDVVVQVEIAEPNDIASVYVLMFVPLLMAWFYYWHQPSHKLYSILLQLSVTSLTVGNVLVNQSLCVLMKAPMALTAVHATSMFAGGTIVACVQRFITHSEAQSSLHNHAKSLYWWLPASLTFAAFQVMDHAVSYFCSISERTVLGNLSPVLSLMLELNLGLWLVNWPSTQTSVSLSSKMSLLAMVFGALIFALQYPDFNAFGVSIAMLQNVFHIIYRLTQRFLLGSVTGVTVAELCAFDGLVLLFPSLAFSMIESGEFWTSWGLWLSNPSVVAMLLLSCATYGMGHFMVMILLKTSTATAMVVLTNVANALCVIMGIYFFGDKDFERPLAFVGIVVSIMAGCWYGDSHHEVPHEPKATDCPGQLAGAEHCSEPSKTKTPEKLVAAAAV